MVKKEVDRRDKLIYYLCIIGFFAIFSTTISKNPVLSLYTQALGGKEIVIGLIAAFSPLAGILFSFPVGILSDRFGRKKFLVLAGAVFLTAPLLYIFVSSPYWLIPIRFFHGMATAILNPVISAIIVSSYQKNKGAKLGVYSSSTLIGRTLAPLLGGFLISYFALYASGLWNYKIVYLAAFIFAIPVFILSWIYKEKKFRKKTLRIKDFYLDLIYILKNKKILSTSLIQMVTYFAFGAFETYLPIYLSLKGVPAFEIGAIFSIQILSIAFSQPIFGKIADKIDKRKQIVFGILVLSIALSLVTSFSTSFELTIIGIVFGLGLSFSIVATSTYTAEIAKKDKLGASLGGLSSIMDVGHTTGPLITGIIISAFSFFWGFFASLVLSVVVILLFILWNFQIKKRNMLRAI